MELQPYTLSVFTENQVGLLHRITTVFTKRHINIDSFTTSESEVTGVFRFTIQIKSTEAEVEKLRKQLEKIIGVLKAYVLREEEAVFQEVALYKVSTANLSGNPIEKTLRENHARVLHIEPDYLMIEKTGHPSETIAFFHALEDYGVLGFSRSGLVAISKKPLYLREHLEAMSQVQGSGTKVQGSGSKDHRS